MPKARSINQNIQPTLLPDFRNLGTVLRIVLLVNAVALLGALSQAISLTDLHANYLRASAMLQPVLLCGLLLLYGLNPWLLRVKYWQGVLLVTLVLALDTLMIDWLGDAFLFAPNDFGVFRQLRHIALSVAGSLVLLAYFRLRLLALSPAREAAKLQALQARIRPHFLFNTLNAVLSIVRSDPKRAEAALEDMSDLFRMAMVEPKELVKLEKEVALARQYLSIESLRLGQRLKVEWNIHNLPQDALFPPLMLQPLLENAVYHGIEPLAEGGTIEVKLYLSGDEIHLEVNNPAQARQQRHTGGNKIALSNIRERLALLFDVEAQYQVENDDSHYRVHIHIPYLRGQEHE